MKKLLIGRKVGMTQVIEEDGTLVPVTVLKMGPCSVVGLRTHEKDGYQAVIIGYDDVSDKKLNKPKAGFYKKQNVKPKRVIREVRVENLDDFALDGALDLAQFDGVNEVTVRSRSKGRGFAGGVKRFGMAIGRKSHGSKSKRQPGSIGAGTYPGRVVKGKKMPGHYGNAMTSVKNLAVVRVVNEEDQLLMVRGAVPGHNGTMVEVYAGG